MSIGILGGGLAGLTVAAHVDGPREVLEKDSRGGGHCQTMQEEGFTYDVGGPHIIFSRDQKMVDYMVGLLDGNVEQRRRETRSSSRDATSSILLKRADGSGSAGPL